MKGVVMMWYRNNYPKAHHAIKWSADLRREKAQRSSSEYAKKQFQRKPYQIGGNDNELSNGKKN